MHNIFTQGAQTYLHNLRMITQVMRASGKLMLSTFLVCFAFLTYRELAWQDFWYLLCYSKAWLRVELLDFLPETMFSHSNIYDYSGNLGVYNDHQLLRYPQKAIFILACLLKYTWQSLLVMFAVFSATMIFWFQRGKKKVQARVLSGMQCVSEKVLSKMIRKKGKDNYHINHIPYPKLAPQKHTMICGTTGTGKSNALYKLLQQIRDQNDRAIIVDSTSQIFTRFFQEGDSFINPLDDRSKGWNIWQEYTSESAFMEFAENLIPVKGHSDQFWPIAARQLLVAALMYESKQRKPSLKRALHLALHEDPHRAFELLKDTEAAGHLNSSNDRTLSSIRSTLSGYINALKYLNDEGDFTIKDWIQSQNEEGSSPSSFLFLACTPGKRTAMAPLFTSLFAQSIKTLMDQDHVSQKTWFIIDELVSLNKISSLGTGLSELRKYNGCMVLGFQNIAQICETYSSTFADILGDLCGTKMVFRSENPSISKRMSGFFGEAEIVEPQESLSYGAHEMRDGVSLSQSKRMKPTVSPTTLQQLPDLTCYIKFAGVFPPTKTTFEYGDLKPRIASFIPNPEVEGDVKSDDVMDTPETHEAHGENESPHESVIKLHPLTRETAAKELAEKREQKQAKEMEEEKGKKVQTHSAQEKEITPEKREPPHPDIEGASASANPFIENKN